MKPTFARILRILSWAAFLAVAPSSAQESGKDKAVRRNGSQEPAVVSFLLSDEARPGEPVTVILAAREPGILGSYVTAQASLRTENGRELASARFFPIDPALSGAADLSAALLAVPFTVQPMKASVVVTGGDASSAAAFRSLPLLIKERAFEHEKIELDRSNTDLRTVPDPRKVEESRVLWALLSRSQGDARSADQAFMLPVTAIRRTSGFGDRRVYAYADGSEAETIHAGIDFGIPSGVPVRACAPGVVVMARDRIATGKSVVISHFPGVYSLYYHLNGLEVMEGDRVQAGQVIGASGSTGLSTGPHLHWEIRVSLVAADPDAFVARPLLDKAAVMSKIAWKYGR